MKVSVIMPVYNAEKYLMESLKHLVFQTLKDIQIILINDGSDDCSLEIMKIYEERFPDKIMIVNNDVHAGEGEARNIGMQYASGEYVGFVNYDDKVTPDMFQKMYEKAVSGDYDIVDCGYYDVGQDRAIIHTSEELAGKLDAHKRKELIVSGGFMVTKIFRRSFLLESGISFRRNCLLMDCEPLIVLTALADSIGNVQEILYCYNSKIKQDKDIYEQYYMSTVYTIEAVYKETTKLESYREIQEAVEYAIMNLCIVSYSACEHQAEELFQRRNSEWEERLSYYLNEYIKISWEENNYIREKIDQETWNKMLCLKEKKNISE